MKLPKLLPEKKLKATARRVSQKAMEQYEEEEPAMKFSSAFMVVLLLHVTAFGGIYAFNNIKAHRVASYANPSKTLEANTDQQTMAPAAVIKEDVVPVSNQTTAPAPSVPKKTTLVQAGVAPVAKSSENVSSNHDSTSQGEARVADSGTIYTTVRGDNPVTIAHHFGVNYDDLLKLNNIENPKKLQIGQKLHIPAKQKN